MNAIKYQASQARKYAAKATRFAAVPLTMVAATSANAADWSTVTGGLDFSGEITAVLAVVGVLAGFFIVRKGGRLLLSMIK
jgi:hypothetical protein|tara:strand:- start:5281 stop:5523 length:243 start_codon:yes stop_codon:yes gene_type:complete